MFALKRGSSVVGIVALAGLAACGSDAAGPGSVNTTAMTQSLNSVTATFTGNAAFQSLASLSSVFPQYAATAALRVSLPAMRGAREGESAWTRVRRERDAMLAGIALAPNSPEALFPSNVLGRWLVWSTSTNRYEVDSVLTGAPTNGIRIRLYAVNPVTQTPAIPLQVLGYVDLTDESTPQANKLGVLLKLGTTTIADYDITAVTGTNTSQFTMAGYIVNGDGTGRVDFTFQINDNSTTNASSFAATLTAQGGAQVVFNLNDDGATTETLLFRVSQGGNSIEITATFTSSTSSGQVKFNGVLVATISEDANGDPVFTGANGHTLTNEERANLAAIVLQGLEAVFGLLFGIFAPALVVFSAIAV